MNEVLQDGLNALNQLARHFGRDASDAELAAFLGKQAIPHDAYAMIEAGAVMGLDVIPLEGPFEELPGCDFPVIVPLHEPNRFAVVHGVAEMVELSDGSGDRSLLDAEAFCDLWLRDDGLGDVLAVSPGEHFESVSDSLLARRNPLIRLSRSLGLYPPWPAKVAFGLLSLGFGTLALLGPQPALGLLLAVAASASLWSQFFAVSCASCSGVRKLAGDLPLAMMGVVGYAVLLVGHCFGLHPGLLAWGLALAGGGHLVLVGTLRWAKMMCVACMITAFAAWMALALSFDGAMTTLWVGLGSALSFGVLLPLARRFRALRVNAGSLALAEQVLAELMPAAGVAGVVFKREGCGYCQAFKSVIGPALQEEFGDDLVIEERDGGMLPIDVPLLILKGARSAVVRDLRGDDAFEKARVGVRVAAGGESSDIRWVSLID